MSNAQWTILVIAGAILLIALGGNGGKSAFVLQAKAILTKMFSGPGG